jgi:hypothetical protein
MLNVGEALRLERLAERDHEFGADPQMLGFLSREAEVRANFAGRPAEFCGHASPPIAVAAS